MLDENRTIVVTFTFINGMKKQTQFHNTTLQSAMENYLQNSTGTVYAQINLGIIYLDKVLYVDFEEY